MLIITEGRSRKETRELIYFCHDNISLNDFHYISFMYSNYLGHISDVREVGKFYDFTL